MEKCLPRIIKVGLAARLEVNKIFPKVHLERVKNVRDRVGTKLGLKSVLWTTEVINRSTTSANAGMLPPH